MSGLIHRIPPHLRSWTTVAAILGVALLFNGLAVVLLIGQWGNIGLSRGESMAPNSDDGTVDFTFRFIYRLREPRRGEVVAIEPSFADGEKLGKRVIGLPGETVTIDGTRVLIDGVELHEPYVRLPWTEEWYDEWQLGPDEYWVMGDNRDHSFDSRSFGPLDEADIVAPMLPIVPLSRLDPLAVVGLVGLLALFPGAPVAGYLGNRRLARRFGRSAWWGLPGALFLGLTTAALLVAGPRRPGPERPNAVTAEFATPTAEWRTVTLGLTKASSWALAGYLAGGAVDAAVPGAIVAGCLWAVTDSLVRGEIPASRSTPVDLLGTALVSRSLRCRRPHNGRPR